MGMRVLGGRPVFMWLWLWSADLGPLLVNADLTYTGGTGGGGQEEVSVIQGQGQEGPDPASSP